MISPELGLTNASGTLTGPETKVIYSPALHELSFQDAAGDILGTPQPILKKQSIPGEVPQSLDELIEMQNIANHSTPIATPEIAKKAGISSQTLNARINRIGQYIPEQLLGCTRKPDKTMLSFGSFAVAVSLETPNTEQRAAAENRRVITRARADLFGTRQPTTDAIDRYDLELRKAKIESNDKHKKNTTDFDNARLRIGKGEYSLELREPIDVLAVRAISALVRGPYRVVASQTNTYQRVDFEKYVWDSMSITERQLFGGGANAVYDEKPIHIVDHLQALMTTLGGRTGQRGPIINYDATQDTFTMPKSTLLEIYLNRPTGPTTTSPNLISDANREVIEQMVATRLEIRAARRRAKYGKILDLVQPQELTEPTAEDRAWVNAWLRGADLTQEDALEGLDRLTSRSGKAALREAFGNDGTAFQQTKRQFHQRIHSVLREGYWRALTERTISGDRATSGDTHKVQHISGFLPADRTKDK